MSASGSESGTRSVRVSAPAKVNPYLDVLMKREDGYHELDTLMLTIELADELRLEFSTEPGVELSVDGPAASEDIPTDENNLAYRAAALVLEASIERGWVRADRGLKLALTKKIPSRAGLGGGSSDAAAACLGAAWLLGNRFDSSCIRTWLSELGSDCVFFYEAADTGFARCNGRGELVRALPAIDREWHFVVLTPELAVATPEVFGALERVLSERDPVPSVREKLFICTESEARLGLFNRLEAAALSAVPALNAWRELLDQNGAQHFLLSGSGSSYFGLYRSRAEAQASLERLEQASKQRGLQLRSGVVAQPMGSGVRLLSAD